MLWNNAFFKKDKTIKHLLIRWKIEYFIEEFAYMIFKHVCSHSYNGYNLLWNNAFFKKDKTIKHLLIRWKIEYFIEEFAYMIFKHVCSHSYNGYKAPFEARYADTNKFDIISHNCYKGIDGVRYRKFFIKKA